MKKYMGAGMFIIITLGAMMLGTEFRYFIDLPSFILVLLLGSLSLYLVPEKKGQAFVEAGWLIFAIGLVAGSFSLNESSAISTYAANIAVTSIGLVYGYLFCAITDMLLKDHI